MKNNELKKFFSKVNFPSSMKETTLFLEKIITEIKANQNERFQVSTIKSDYDDINGRCEFLFEKNYPEFPLVERLSKYRRIEIHNVGNDRLHVNINATFHNFDFDGKDDVKNMLLIVEIVYKFIFSKD